MCACSVTQSCLTLHNPMDCSLPGSSAHGVSRQEYCSGVPSPSPIHQLVLPFLLPSSTTTTLIQAIFALCLNDYNNLLTGLPCQDSCSLHPLTFHSISISTSLLNIHPAFTPGCPCSSVSVFTAPHFCPVPTQAWAPGSASPGAPSSVLGMPAPFCPIGLRCDGTSSGGRRRTLLQQHFPSRALFTT